MSIPERELKPQSGRAPMEPEDALRMLRRVGLGLLAASLLVDWGATHFVRWRLRARQLQFKIVPDVGAPGAVLADIAIEILDATSPR
jgi:hypothetical protein